MSKKDKLEEKFFKNPINKTLEWSELVKLLNQHGFEAFPARGGSSKVKFYNKEFDIFVSFHKPHPGNILKEYVVKETREIISTKNALKALKEKDSK